MNSPRSKTLEVDRSGSSSPCEDAVSPLVTSETIGEIDKPVFTLMAEHGISTEDISKDLRKAYLYLPREQHFDTEPYFTDRIYVFKWKDEDGLKQRFFDRLNHLNCLQAFEEFGNPNAMENLWTGDDNVGAALYTISDAKFGEYLLIATAGLIRPFEHCNGKANLLLLMWELYFDKPETYLQMLKMVMSKSNIPHWVYVLSPDYTQAKDKPWDNIFSRLPSVCRFLDSRPGDVRFVEHLCQDVERKKKDDVLFRCYLHIIEMFIPDFPYDAVRRKSPAIIGLNKAIHDAVDSYLDRVEEELEQFLDKDDGKLEGESELQLEKISGENPDDVLLLYAVSGSGKTRTIEHLLQRNWGYYFLPGNLDLTAQRSLYDSRREGYSKDSCFLWKIVQNIDNIMPGMDPNGIPIWEWSRRLILSRHLVFDRFLKVATKKSGAKTPAKWLGFQKSCSTFDPFESLFMLLLLINSGSQCLEFKMPYLVHVPSQNSFYWCLDEAQCYLDARIPNMAHTEDNYQNFFQLISEDILLRSTYPLRNMRFIVSGTSLKLQKIVTAIRNTMQYPRPKYEPTFTKCRQVTNFPLLTSGEKLRNLIKERGLLEKLKMHFDFVKKRGVPLQGRYLWSARYVDRLENHLDRDCHLDGNAISKAADDTIKEAKESLKERLSRLREEKCNEILQELCWVVIQSDLLDRPTKFEKDEDHRMISEAFAVVETQRDSLVGILQERLAMEAAIEWFREESWDMYRDSVTKYLRFSTNDAGSFGKAAEWFLALELWNCLHHSNRMTGSEGVERRERIFTTFSKVSKDGKRPIQSGETISRPVEPRLEPLQLASTHRLVEGKKIGHIHDGGYSSSSSSREIPNLDQTVPIWEWMRSVRIDEEPVASFYFPDILAGPDIVFSLEPKDSSSGGRILCILQLKTGPINDMHKAISTTNLKMSYQGTNKNQPRDEHREKLKEELDHWKDKIIIRILVCTAKSYERDEDIAKHLSTEIKTSSHELFFLCDKTYTESLFGETFARLADATKNHQSLSKLIEIRSKKRVHKEDTTSRKKVWLGTEGRC